MRGSGQPVVMWFRKDLRLADNPALHWAVETGRPVVALFVLEENEALRGLGGASKWWLHHSLAAHRQALQEIGIRLVLRCGNPLTILSEIAADSAAECVVWNRRYDAPEIALDKAVKARLAQEGIEARSFNGSLLVEPWRMRTRSGTPFRVFTAFWKSLAAGLEVPDPLPVPNPAAPSPDPLASLDLEDFGLLPRRDWARRFGDCWTPGEAGARARLDDFVDGGLADYETGRDFPSRDATSGLSPHLRFGEISPVQIWRAVRMRGDAVDGSAGGASKFLSEIAWREFAYHLLYYNPDLARENYAKSFDAFPWRHDAALFAAWKAGKTGYPIVDAGMRELRQTGWMHNRVRMITASFLVKHLLIDWRCGEAWFWDNLVDADPANNPAGWQWVAGSGADASPYFRIFNPILQGEKFDAAGGYVRKWVPELAELDKKWLHKPWLAPPQALVHAGIEPGRTYPDPVVAHDRARNAALAAFRQMRSTPPGTLGPKDF